MSKVQFLLEQVFDKYYTCPNKELKKHTWLFSSVVMLSCP